MGGRVVSWFGRARRENMGESSVYPEMVNFFAQRM